MPFKYVATSSEGKLIKGVSELTERAAVVAELEGEGLYVVSIEATGAFNILGAARLRRLITGVRHMDKVLLTKHLAVMLRSGLTLLESLNVIVDQSTSWRMRVIVGDLIKAVERGGSLATALFEYPQVFSPFYVNIVRAGELSGTLEQNLDYLADQLTHEHELRGKIKSAMFYPVIVLIGASAIGLLFAIYVIPQVANLFTGLKGVKLPTVTVVLLKFSVIAKAHPTALLLGITSTVVGIVWLLKRKFLAPATHWVALRIPAIGPIVRNVNLARFTLVFGTMLRSGVPITQSIAISAQVLTNRYYQAALMKLRGELERGEPLSDGLSRNPKLFPTITSKMVAVGERSGRLEEVLKYLAEFYRLEVDTALKTISSVIEPALLLIIGGFTLAIAFAIIIPIYNFIGFIGKI